MNDNAKLIARIDAMCAAYPVDIFPVISDEDRLEHGLVVSRASAQMARHICAGILADCRAALSLPAPQGAVEARYIPVRDDVAGFHDRVWDAWRAAKLDDAMLGNLSVHSIRKLCDVLFVALSAAPAEGQSPPAILTVAPQPAAPSQGERECATWDETGCNLGCRSEAEHYARQPSPQTPAETEDWVERLADQYGAAQAAALRGDKTMTDSADHWLGIIAGHHWHEIIAALRALPGLHNRIKVLEGAINGPNGWKEQYAQSLRDDDAYRKRIADLERAAVPREPTAAMVHAGRLANFDWGQGAQQSAATIEEHIWTAMYDAAQPPSAPALSVGWVHDGDCALNPETGQRVPYPPAAPHSAEPIARWLQSGDRHAPPSAPAEDKP